MHGAATTQSPHQPLHFIAYTVDPMSPPSMNRDEGRPVACPDAELDPLPQGLQEHQMTIMTMFADKGIDPESIVRATGHGGVDTMLQEVQIMAYIASTWKKEYGIDTNTIIQPYNRHGRDVMKVWLRELVQMSQQGLLPIKQDLGASIKSSIVILDSHDHSERTHDRRIIQWRWPRALCYYTQEPESSCRAHWHKTEVYSRPKQNAAMWSCEREATSILGSHSQETGVIARSDSSTSCGGQNLWLTLSKVHEKATLRQPRPTQAQGKTPKRNDLDHLLRRDLSTR